MKPVVAIYSTFMQRAMDQLIQDISLQNTPAVFVLDRSGPVPDDGETHQGIFDISLMRPIPNLSLLAPASAAELISSLLWATDQDIPVVIRYPKACCPPEINELYLPLEIGKGVLLRYHSFISDAAPSNCEKAKTLIVCTGGILPEAITASRCLFQQQNFCDVYNLRFLKPLNKEYFTDLVNPYDYIIFVEDGIRIGGIGTFLESLLQREYGNKKTAVCGFPDRYIPQGKRQDILDEAHLSSTHIIRKILEIQKK
jgi:1-deoxy-D-xylulose-5-phosphate synthase